MHSQPHSPIQPALPTILTASRKRRTNPSTPSLVTPNQPPYLQKIIDVGKNHTDNNRHGIRDHIDTCLKAILQNCNTDRQQVEGRKEKSVHRVDTKLIKKYQEQLQADYQLADPFGPHPQQKKTTPKHSTPRSHSQQPSRSQSKRKTYISMTVRGGEARKSPPTETPARKAEQPTERSHNPSPWGVAGVGPKIEVEFRYCLSCLQPILSQNIPHHQRHECPQLSTWYDCSYEQLGRLVMDKITLLKATIRNNIARLKRMGDEWGRGVEGELLEGLQEQVERQVGGEVKEERNKEGKELTNSDYRQKINQIFLESMELTEKVSWFTKVYTRLQQYQPALSVSQFILPSFPSPRHSSVKAQQYQIHDVLRPVSQFNPPWQPQN